jgi:mannosyltransferase OCH1-like enzyme
LNSPYRLHHGSDIERLRLLIEYGGIYLDNDVFVVQNLDHYRKFEMSLEWNYEDALGTQVYLLHKDTRFLRLCLDTYRDYRSHLWYYNAGELPTK